ncbi:MAG: gliding motility-associated C-terminal domain-containing protein [Bacteroidales bacterium]|nr:gliding motility-associated C-terminal domain-containing protein [Bacteroidales bacterium]
MNEYYENKDNGLRDFKERLSEYRPQPEEKIWKNIERKVAKKTFPFKTLSIIGLIGIVAVVVFVVSAPNHTQPTSSNNTLPDYVKSTKISKTILSKIENIVKRENKKNSDIKTENTIANRENLPSIPMENNLNKEDSVLNNKTEITENTTVEKETATANTTETTKAPTVEEKKIEKKIDGEEEEVSLPDKLYIPTAFTPTQSTNNVFKPAYRDLKSYDMKIYSRNGSLLFSSKDISNGWDGKIKGSLGKVGTYVYIITFTNKDGKQVTQKGNFMLLN